MEVSPYSELVRTLLARRGIESIDEIAAFLRPDYDLHTHSPFLIEGMERAVARILAAITQGERIAVYADFDCDGIPGAAILWDFFEKIGYGNMEVYLPHRDREGYGFHTEAIEQLASREVKLIITVDVGTTAVEAVRFAKEKGVEVIVTDHHEIPGAMPECVAVLNPKLGNYPFPHLCGAATAFKLVQALLEKGKEAGDAKFVAIPTGWEKWLLDLVCIATIADMVPLLGENRALAHWGLQVLRKSQRPGISALCNKLRLRRGELTEDDIGFSIAPRINAASRMDEPDLAFKLLTTKDPREAEMLAARLEQLNSSRKGVVGGIVREVRKRVKERYVEGDSVVVLGNPDWKPSLLGLAANSIISDRGGVVCLWGRDALGRLKGSCRTDGRISVVDLFMAAPEAFTEYGGHAASGGFSVSHESVHTLPERLADAAVDLLAKSEKKVPTVSSHDALTSLSEISMPLFRDLSQLSPFGVGNPKPIFRVGNARILETKRFGKEKNHVELTLACLESDVRARAFDFFRAPEDFTFVPVVGKHATILATVERDSFRGGLALRLVDVLPA